MPGSSNKQHILGFSLVELSVVLIILGLLAAGITAGNSLVKGSKYRAVVSELGNFQTAINSFILQYEQHPGDFNNAFAYWGGTDCTDAVVSNTSPNNKACNGDADGTIEYGIGEGFNAWEHLSLAELIPGNYTGYATVANQTDIGVNGPASKWKPVGYSMRYLGGFGGNRIYVGAFKPGNYTNNDVFTPRDVSNLDKKMDDGLPRSGIVWAPDGNKGAAGCINTAETAYNLNLETTVCHMFYNIDGPASQ